MSRQKPPHRCLSTALADLCGDLRGGAAIEFALVGSTAILMIVGVMFVGFLIFITQELDRTTSIAARQIMTGAVQKQAMTQGSFLTNVVCPALPISFTCSNVIVNVQAVTEAAGPGGYYSFVNSNQTALIIPPLSNASTSFTPGLQGDYVYLQIIYPVTFIPAFLAAAFGTSTYNGAPAYLAVSTAAFRNEQY